MTSSEPIEPRGKPRPIKLIVITLVIALALYVGIHGAARGWAMQRELQRRLICASNLKGLGTSSKIYSTAGWDGKTPIVAWLVQTGQVAAHQTQCPGAIAPNYVALIPPEGPAEIDSRLAIAYEPKSNHGGEGGNILFADGHVSFIRVPLYDELIAAASQSPLAPSSTNTP